MKKHAIVECLHKQQITNYETLDSFLQTNSIEHIVSLTKDIQNIIEDADSNQTYTPFMFFPNPDLSGIGGCNEINCKIRRAQTFSLFASLYADIVYLSWDPISFEKIDYSDEQIICDLIEELRKRLALLLTYASLINVGIIHIRMENVGICRDCLRKCLTEQSPFGLGKLASQYLNQASMSVHYDFPGTVSIAFSNLDGIVPHGHLIKTFPMRYFPDLAYYKDGNVIRQKKIKQKLLNDLILESLAESYSTAAHSEIYNAKMITDVPLDVRIAQFLSSNETEGKILKQGLVVPDNCDLPIIGGVSLENILHLREEEKDAFNRYRNAVTNFLEQKHSNSINLKTLYDQEIYPQLTELEAKINFAREGRLQKWLGSSLVMLSTLGVCAMNGIIGSVGQAVSLSGGISNIMHGAQNKVVELLEENQAKKENKYFFLWKLKNKKKINK